MQFVYPAFLFGLAAMAIPLVIHLFNFRRFKTIYFTNVRFLRQVQEETATKNKYKSRVLERLKTVAIEKLKIMVKAKKITVRKTSVRAKCTFKAFGEGTSIILVTLLSSVT